VAAADRLTDRAAVNVVLGGFFFLGGLIVGPLFGFRTRITASADYIDVQNAFRRKRVERVQLQRVYEYGKGFVCVDYLEGTRTRSVSSAAAQGYLGAWIFGRRPRSEQIVAAINNILSISPSS
jgi:hypothetical protein